MTSARDLDATIRAMSTPDLEALLHPSPEARYLAALGSAQNALVLAREAVSEGFGYSALTQAADRLTGAADAVFAATRALEVLAVKVQS